MTSFYSIIDIPILHMLCYGTTYQNIHKIWNFWDEHAAILGLTRLPGEGNIDLKNRIQNLGKFTEDSSRQGLINALSSAFGYNQYNVITRRIFILTNVPYITSTFTVEVDDVVQTQVTASTYSTATTGYIVWKDKLGEYTQILEFITPPTFTRDTTTRKHNGSKVEVTYQYRDGDTAYYYTDKCSPYYEDDDSFMGWYPEVEGSIKVRCLNDTEWLDNADNGFKNSDGTPTEKLKNIWRNIDRNSPITWGP